jgi:hypothetical protein
MSNAEANETPAKNLLAGYISEDEMAQARGVGVRALRAERQRSDGPPWVKLSRSVWYPEAGFRDWLKSIEQRPVRARKAA